MIGGVNYYTGQVFDMKNITKTGHEAGAFVGFDLAHGVGNILLNLNKWKVDFAAWCSYKYLNSGPGGVSGMYINERHVNNPNIFKLQDGGAIRDRFKMPDKFSHSNCRKLAIINAPVLSMAAHKASLDFFQKLVWIG